jgi:hypothetical protein
MTRCYLKRQRHTLGTTPHKEIQLIKLDAASQTTYSSARNGVTITEIVDTLIVRYVELNLVEGSILAIIDRGTMVTTPEVPAVEASAPGVTPVVLAHAVIPAHTDFVAGDTPLWVDVRPDGSFSSRYGAWVGNVQTAGAIVGGLKQAFDGFLLASGAVTGTAV